ncbi:MAG TPA: hypothetical protein VGA61_07185, partial [Anaerolineae bacterium]
MQPLIVIIVLILLGAAILVIVGMKDRKGADPLETRLAEFAARGESVSLEEIELSQPLSDRIFLPLARKFGEFAIRFTPQNALQST